MNIDEVIVIHLKNLDERYYNMKVYRDLDNDSGVRAYEIGEESITVRFKTGAVYLYNYLSTGALHIEQMKRLAEAGDGLNSYIGRKVKGNYAKRLV